MDLYTKIQKQIKWIVEQIQCIKTGACIECQHPVTSVNGETGDVVIDGTEIELVEGDGIYVTQTINDLDNTKYDKEGGLVSGPIYSTGATIISGNIDLSLGNYFTYLLSSNTTFTLLNKPSQNMNFVIKITTGGSGGYFYTFDKVDYTVKYVNLDVDETVGNVTEWYCRWEGSPVNTLYINSLTGYKTL